MKIDEYVKDCKDRIERDLASFGDPGTTVEVIRSGRQLGAEWTMRGKKREAMFFISKDRGISVKFGRNQLPYRQFIAGPEMADLKSVARMILQVSISKSRLFIGTKAKLVDSESAAANQQSQSAVRVLTEILNQEDADRTRVVMVTGDAGAGKTHVLQEFVRLQAEDYIHGQTEKLLLYVNAQGRALSRLNEALATELQDLKVNLTYHSVSVLARLGILIPVIDGFDELLGVSGYDDAFSSLTGFLNELEGEGQMIASARSVYYTDEFLSRMKRMNVADGNRDLKYDSVQVQMLKWDDENRNQYLDELETAKSLSDAAAENLRKRVRKILDNQNPSSDLASKPLFFTQIVGLLATNPEFYGGDDLLRSVVKEYLSREQKEKLLDRQSEELVTEDQFEHLMRELAEEMWNQETRELDSRSVREIAEYVVEDQGLPEAAKQVVIERMPTLAFLTRSDNPASHSGISFEHELFFFYFLARSIVSKLDSKENDVRIILSRSALPEDVAERVAMELDALRKIDTGEKLQGFVDCLSNAGVMEWRRTTQVRENAGLLILALLRAYAQCNGEVNGCMIRSVIFPGSHLKGIHLNRCSLVDVTFQYTDLSSANFENCRAQNVLFLEPYVALRSTRLDLQGLDISMVHGVRVRNQDSTETSYDPTFIAETLEKCGVAVPTDLQPLRRDVPDEYIKLLERLMRAYRRTNSVCIADQNLAGLFRNPRWRMLEKLLDRHGVIEKKPPRSTSGSSKKFLRFQFLEEQIMSGLNKRTDVDSRIQAFWQDLESETAAKDDSG